VHNILEINDYLVKVKRQLNRCCGVESGVVSTLGGSIATVVLRLVWAASPSTNNVSMDRTIAITERVCLCGCVHWCERDSSRAGAWHEGWSVSSSDGTHARV